MICFVFPFVDTSDLKRKQSDFIFLIHSIFIGKKNDYSQKMMNIIYHIQKKSNHNPAHPSALHIETKAIIMHLSFVDHRYEKEVQRAFNQSLQFPYFRQILEMVSKCPRISS